MAYLDNVLIHLKRVYSKDETVSALIKKLRETEHELGVVTSERDEFEFDNKRLLIIKKDYKNVLKGSVNARDKIRELKAENRFLIKENEDLRNKF